MNLSEIVTNVKAELSPATNIDNLIKRWANRAQGRFLATATQADHLFSWTRLTNLSITTENGKQEYAISPIINLSKIIYFTERTYNRRMKLLTLQEFRERVPDPTDNPGNPQYAYLAGFSPVEKQPTSASQLTFVSTASDNAVIRLEGFNAAGTAIIGENLTLNGTTPVVSVNSYLKVLSRGINGFITGTVTVTSNGGVVTNAVISPRNRQGIYPLVGFWPIPNSVLTLYYDAYIDLPPLVNDNDFSLIPERYHEALEQYCLYRGYRHKKDSQGSLEAKQAFGEIVMEAISDDMGPEREIVMESFDPFYDHLGNGTLPGRYPRDY